MGTTFGDDKIFERDYNEGVERGCGVREPGGVYACCGLSKRGRPIEEFLFDPPLPLGALAIAPRGVTLLERPDGSGIVDIYDWVGESGYPNVADMIEEIRRYGLSRRLSRKLDFAQLQPGSLIFLIHPRAIITNHADLYDLLRDEADSGSSAAHQFRCMCGRKAHEDYPYLTVGNDWETETCASLWYEDVRKGEASYDPDMPLRTVTRELGSTTYTARQAPHEFRGEYEPGIFMRLPVKRLEVVADPDGELDIVAREAAEASGLPVIDVDF